MTSRYREERSALRRRLGHAFRYGSSAFRLGLIPEGVSDHLPVKARLPLAGDTIRLLSWNLLADEHLFNNFMNITGSRYLEAELDRRLGGADKNIYHGMMYHLFAEIAQYFLRQTKQGQLTICSELLQRFSSNEAQPSRLARSRNPEVALQRVAQVEKARRVLKGILSESGHPQAHEFRLALQQSMELIYHIQSPAGALKWENRYNRLLENEAQITELCSQDILALQECTCPADIEYLIRVASRGKKKMQFITHNLGRNGVSTDNVVLAFDREKYQLVGEPFKSSFGGKKPALYCRLRDLVTGEECVVGSIHHPGGDHDERSSIMASVDQLLAGDSLPFFIAGDYNHTEQQFTLLDPDRDDAGITPIYYPSNRGSMAGSDYGNTNKGIDAVLSNVDLTGRVVVSAVADVVKPARTPIDITFAIAAEAQIVHNPTLTPLVSMFVQPQRARQVCSVMPVRHTDSDLSERQELTICKLA